jgi:hypothetical protein
VNYPPPPPPPVSAFGLRIGLPPPDAMLVLRIAPPMPPIPRLLPASPSDTLPDSDPDNPLLSEKMDRASYLSPPAASLVPQPQPTFSPPSLSLSSTQPRRVDDSARQYSSM